MCIRTTDSWRGSYESGLAKTSSPTVYSFKASASPDSDFSARYVNRLRWTSEVRNALLWRMRRTWARLVSISTIIEYDADYWAGASTKSNSQVQKGGSSSNLRAASSLVWCSLNSAISECFTPNTASSFRYLSMESNRCVVTGQKPGADTAKWTCAGRHGCRLVAPSNSQTGPSAGI